MKKGFILVAGIWICFGLFHLSVSAGSRPETGGILPAIMLTVPEKAAERAYLGLSDEKIFSLSDIKAKVLIVEIFSMYCPYCQAEAPVVNRLYRKIEANPLLKNDIRVIGIGVGNSSFEVNVFRKKYAIPFPLFADPDYKVHDEFGNVRTPYFIGIKRENRGIERVFLVQPGGLENVDEFLDRIFRESSLDDGTKKRRK
ncbi:MAG: TlpA family protein disulfide reductase [Deltaproteobacteria bacterium]|nr:TlpA family protein disulfide reductase [Deltaproteobacteria bacterium]